MTTVAQVAFQMSKHSASRPLSGHLPLRSDKFVIRLRGLPWEATPQDVRVFLRGVKILNDNITFLRNQQGKPTGMGCFIVLSVEDWDDWRITLG